jgi:hypothetical protein
MVAEKFFDFVQASADFMQAAHRSTALAFPEANAGTKWSGSWTGREAHDRRDHPRIQP